MDENRVICEQCPRSYKSVRIMKRHVRKVHGKIKHSNEFICDFCKKTYGWKHNLIYHFRTKHNLCDVKNKKRKFTPSCPICQKQEATLGMLSKHLCEYHHVDIEAEEMNFKNISHFELWKDEEEEKGKFRFRRFRGTKKVFFYCHCSGRLNSISKGKRMRWKPSIKINGTCPVRMELTYGDGDEVKVKYFKTHVGHTPTIKNVHLKKEERAALAAKISAGVKFDRIIQDVRESAQSSSDLQRIHLLDKRDLYNITREFSLDMDIFSQDDEISTQLLISQLTSLGEESPILLFKKQGEEAAGLRLDDFMIVVMTKYQEEVISLYAVDKILVDSTHGMTSYDFQLTTLVTVDEYGAGCPVAMCLSNRVDATALSAFFRAVQGKVGTIPSEVFMSDDANAYYNAWCEVMGPPVHRLLCTWHVDKNWKKNLLSVKIPKRGELYKGLRSLLEMEEVQQFEKCMLSFVNHCKSDDDTKAFGEYFENTYSKRPEVWAYSYRRCLGLNTNMYLEALHRNLKYCYLDGKQNRRIDKCLSLIIKFSRDMMFERIIREAKNRPTHRMNAIRHAHIKSTDVQSSAIQQCGDTSWTVVSQSLRSKLYTVKAWDAIFCREKRCPLSCMECNICVHEMACTCLDYAIRGNLCKHIHAVARNRNATSSVDVTADALEFETHARSVVKSCGRNVWTEERDWSSASIANFNAISGYLLQLPKDHDLQKEIFKKSEALLQLVKQNCPVAVAAPIPVAPYKNIEKQLRFYSTKKKRKPATGMGANLQKPTEAQKQEISTALMTPLAETIYVSSDATSDHSYFA